jgi:3-phenylpropionate/trans-cinnamate dioxygenase ferredoxin component
VIPLGRNPGEGPSADGAFVDVLGEDELPPGGRRSVLLGFKRVQLYHGPDRVHAFAEACPHALQPLADAEISAGSVRCQKHGACFDLTSGSPLNGVTAKHLPIYRVRIQAGRILIAEPA